MIRPTARPRRNPPADRNLHRGGNGGGAAAASLEEELGQEAEVQARRLLEALEAVRMGNLSKRLKRETDDVFGELADSYNGMVESLNLFSGEVTRVLRISRSEIKAAPESLAKVENDHTKGVLTIESRLVILLDLVELLSDENFAALAEVPAAERTPVDHARKKKGGSSRLPGEDPGNESESLQAVGAATAGDKPA